MVYFASFQVEMEEVEQPVVEKKPDKEIKKDEEDDVDEEDLVGLNEMNFPEYIQSFYWFSCVRYRVRAGP